MKAIALAAGRGTRLGDITRQLPKCMVEVGGKPLLLRNLEWAAANGIDEVAVNLHHLPDVITSYFSVESPLPLHWSYEPKLLGTAGTVRSLSTWLDDEPFAVIYADNLIDCNLGSILETHRRVGADLTVALFWREDTSQSGVAELADDRIVRFIEKPTAGTSSSHWVSAGLLVFESQAARSAPPEGDIGWDLLPRLISDGHVVGGYRMGSDEALHWVDTPEDLLRTQTQFVEAG